MRSDRRRSRPAFCVLCLCASVALVPLDAGAASVGSVAEKAKESGCLGKPKVVEGSMYKCETSSGAWSYFNVPDGTASGAGPTVGSVPTEPLRRVTPVTPPGNARSAAPGFPRVDPETQKGRDDVRRRVLQDELVAEEKLLTEARTSYADGAPVPLPEERNNTDRYRERISRLRQAVALHERNVEALRKEISGLR